MRRMFGILVCVAIVLSAVCVGRALPKAQAPSAAPESRTEAVSSDAAGRAVRLSVPYLSQKDTLPTGCEIVSAAMLLKYWGVRIEPRTLAERFLESAPLSKTEAGFYAPHPDKAFIGDPTTPYGYGCYAPVIVRMLTRVLDGAQPVVNTTGCTLEALCERYLSRKIPVLIWATIEMQPPTLGTSWTVSDTGERFTWKRGEHCLVLTGFDDSYYYLNDPYNGNGRVRYEKRLVEARFAALGMQSCAILPTHAE